MAQCQSLEESRDKNNAPKSGKVTAAIRPQKSHASDDILTMQIVPATRARGGNSNSTVMSRSRRSWLMDAPGRWWG